MISLVKTKKIVNPIFFSKPIQNPSFLRSLSFSPKFNFSQSEQVEKNELLVKKGKEKIVGLWLLLTAGSVLAMILLGGYTRLSKSGLSMTKWKPIAYKYPANQEEWEVEFENYKVFLFISPYTIFLEIS